MADPTCILVVEDDPDMRDLIREGLEGSGYAVRTAETGVDALVHAQQGEIALAVVDLMLPGMSGFEVCRRLREGDAALPILIMTARDAVEDRIQGLDSGADDYITKPFHFGELTARIRAQLRKRDSLAAPPLTAGNLALDAVRLRAEVAGRSLSLSVKEFLLLRDLVAHPGTARSRGDVLREVWGSEDDFDPTIVDQYVSYVRRKLDGAGATVHIVTVRGVGYRLETA